MSAEPLNCPERGHVFAETNPTRVKSVSTACADSDSKHAEDGKSSIVHVVYRDHVLFRNINPSQIHPATREAVGWVAEQNEDYILLVSEMSVNRLPDEKGDNESGLLILKNDILEINKIGNHKTIRDVKGLNSKELDISEQVSKHRTAKNPALIKAKKIENMQTLIEPNRKKQQQFATITTIQKQPSSRNIKYPPSLEKFVRNALQNRKSSLIPYTLQSPALMELARHIKIHCTGSVATLYLYILGAEKYCQTYETDPDPLIQNCITAEGLPDEKALQIESRRLDDYIGMLKDEMYSPGHISNCVKAVKALFRQNGLEIRLPYKLHKYNVSKDRAPTIEEIKQIVELATLRDKIIVLMLAFGGFRAGTLTQLKYRHVKFDLERGVTPLHIHVPAEITKGKYGDYDTFIAKDAVDLLKAYLEARRTGGLPNKIPPENIVDDSPLIRDEHSKLVKPLSQSQIYNIVHRLLAQAGLLGSKVGGRYQVRPHSLRKFFKSQLMKMGVQNDYVEHMMGHVVSTYHDVKMNGIDFLRCEYAKAELSIRPKHESNKMAIVRDFLKSMGLKPEEVLSKEAQAIPGRTVVGAPRTMSEQEQIDVMLKALMQKVKQDIIAETRGAFPKTV